MAKAREERGVTTMKVSTVTRDRLRSLAGEGETLEDVVVSALELLEREAFWSAAAAAAAEETAEQRQARLEQDRDLDRWMDGLE